MGVFEAYFALFAVKIGDKESHLAPNFVTASHLTHLSCQSFCSQTHFYSFYKIQKQHRFN